MKETSEKTANKPLIFLTNDDGVNAKGLRMLIETLRQEARLLVVAPEQAQSGMGHAITLTRPLYLKKVTDEPGLSVYACNGTPVDCVKIAFDCMMLGKEMPSLVVSGINHGSNAAVNNIYSGTMGAAMEGCILGIPSIGYSLLSHSPEADFSGIVDMVADMTRRVLASGLPEGICLNVNFPKDCTPQGVKTVRAARGHWTEEYADYAAPGGHPFYWLTGKYHNTEPDAEDTDEYWLARGWATVVPIRPDQTAADKIGEIEKLLG